MPVALITGISGQDGSYLASYLIEMGYHVIGVVKDKKRPLSFFTSTQMKSIELIEFDFLDVKSIAEKLHTYKPNEIYNFAAYSSGSGIFDNPIEMADLNGLAVLRILEAIREVNNNIRFCQASSSEIFGDAIDSPQSESSITNPRSPYGAAKLFADTMIRIYRHKYKIFACSAILYNHESPIRRLEFVTRKITHEAARIKLGLSNELRLGNLDAVRDWGFAGDYIKAMWLMLQKNIPDDYVISTGEAHTVRDFCNISFGYLGLDYRDYVRQDPLEYRPFEKAPLVGNSSKARKFLKWSPVIDFQGLIKIMIDADLESCSTNTLRER